MTSAVAANAQREVASALQLVTSSGGMRKWAAKRQTFRERRPSLSDTVLGPIAEAEELHRSRESLDDSAGGGTAAAEEGTRKWKVKFDIVRIRRRSAAAASAAASPPSTLTPSPPILAAPTAPAAPAPLPPSKSAGESVPIRPVPVASMVVTAPPPPSQPAPLPPSDSPQVSAPLISEGSAVPFFRPQERHNSGFSRSSSGQLSEEQEKQVKLFNVICELCFTEDVYLNDLETLIEIYLRPLRDAEYLSSTDAQLASGSSGKCCRYH